MDIQPILSGMRDLAASLGLSWSALGLLTFFAAALLLDLFDISLPRGDSIGVSGAVLVVALVEFGAIAALAICLLAPLLALLVRRSEVRYITLLPSAISRSLALLVAWVCLALLPQYKVGDMPAVEYLIVPAAYLLCELAVAQSMLALRTGRPFGRMVWGGLVMQAPILLAQWSAAALLLIIYPTMMAWSLIPVTVLLLLMRQSAALLFQVRDTYRTTVEVLVEAAESQNPVRVGHSERTASIARQIAMKMGLSGHEVDRISYVALLHDIDAIGEGQSAEGSDMDIPQGHSSRVLEGSEFFSDVLPVLRMCDGQVGDGAEDPDTLSAMVVALASDIDALAHPQLESLHGGSTCERVTPFVSQQLKARVVSAALLLGFKIPAVI